MLIDFWIDPICPWCWVTSRWILDVAPHRDLQINWRPISLKVKNGISKGADYFETVSYSHGLLRVIESVRAAEGDAPIGNLYTVYGENIHHRGDDSRTAAQLLAEAGLSESHAAAFDDPSWDDAIHAAMAEGLGLVGNDVGTPIIGFTDDRGRRVGFFGPVISRRLAHDDALRLWDAFVAIAPIEGLWEIKRTRTEGPDFTPPT